MINTALTFLVSELNSFFRNVMNLQEDKVILASISEIDGSFAVKNNDKVTVSLVNIAEEAALRNNMGNTTYGSTYATVNPTIYLNLYVLCAASFNTYDESLKFISGVVSYFQGKNVFNHTNAPALPQQIDKLIVELEKTTYQDMSYIWGMLGSKYLPCVLYKVRMLTIQEGEWKDSIPVISSVGVN